MLWSQRPRPRARSLPPPAPVCDPEIPGQAGSGDPRMWPRVGDGGSRGVRSGTSPPRDPRKPHHPPQLIIESGLLVWDCGLLPAWPPPSAPAGGAQPRPTLSTPPPGLPPGLPPFRQPGFHLADSLCLELLSWGRFAPPHPHPGDTCRSLHTLLLVKPGQGGAPGTEQAGGWRCCSSSPRCPGRALSQGMSRARTVKSAEADGETLL